MNFTPQKNKRDWWWWCYPKDAGSMNYTGRSHMLGGKTIQCEMSKPTTNKKKTNRWLIWYRMSHKLNMLVERHQLSCSGSLKVDRVPWRLIGFPIYTVWTRVLAATPKINLVSKVPIGFWILDQLWFCDSVRSKPRWTYFVNGHVLDKFTILVGGFQPVWTICQSNWIVSPGRADHSKKTWNRHLL